MPHPGTDTSIRLDKHHDHPSAITGKSIHMTHALLSLHGFEPTGETTTVMVRIDNEEPYYAQEAAHALRAQGMPLDISPELLEDINTEWDWANYPMDWLNRDEIRDVSNEAQKVHDSIRHGRLQRRYFANAPPSGTPPSGARAAPTVVRSACPTCHRNIPDPAPT